MFNRSYWPQPVPASSNTLLEELDVPYLRPISMLGYTVGQWLEDPRGLCVRDVGHFMTIQESKGTIEPIVVGGLKASVHVGPLFRDGKRVIIASIVDHYHGHGGIVLLQDGFQALIES